MAGGKTGIGKAKARQSSRNDKRGLHARMKANMPAKAGRRRPPNIRSVIDIYGKKQWVVAQPDEVKRNIKLNHTKKES